MASAMMSEQTPALRIATDETVAECDEAVIYRDRLRWTDARVLELGCGGAQHTRAIAQIDDGIEIVALEVDRIQHEKNLSAPPVPNIVFKLGGAEAIPEADASFDIVVMFKSLHHVPVDALAKAFDEIRRVLKPGGFVYISEPVFAGEFNEILRLFHDEQAVRLAAFDAITAAVAAGLFESVEEIFFNAPVFFSDFADFEQKIINATHSEHRLSDGVYREVKSRMQARMGDDGIRFSAPMRIDLLRKPA